MNVKRGPCLLVGENHSCACLLSSLFSDRNSPCCRNCMFEKAETRCQEAINATCKGTSACTGVWRQMTENSAGLSRPSWWWIIYIFDTCRFVFVSRSARQASAVSVHRPSTPTTTRRAWITAAATKGSATLSARPFRIFSPAPATVKEANKLILII